MFHTIFLFFDSILIWFYRLPEIPVLGFFLGTTVLAGLSVLVGEATRTLVYLLNRDYYEGLQDSMVSMHNSSIKAIGMKDKTNYKLCNRQANEYFGRVFFSQAALFSCSLWALPFALAWMHSRFSEIEFPFPGTELSVGFAFVFIPLFVLVRILFGKIRPRLPFFRRLDRAMKEAANSGEQPMSWGDLGK
jgi:hypothetical protein